MEKNEIEQLQAIHQDRVETLWREVSWTTPREKADSIRREAIQACHALHRAMNLAYHERCEREQIGEQLVPELYYAVAFPEEIYKAYAEKKRADGTKLGVFCEQDVPLLLEHMNYYLTSPITMDGLQDNYMPLTNLRGGLDRLRDDLAKQGVLVVTSSGTTGAAFSLIPFDQESLETLLRMEPHAFDELTNVPGYGPIDPTTDCLISFSPIKGSMMQAVSHGQHAERFGDRAFLTIPSEVQTKELRWKAGIFAGLSGTVLRWGMRPIQRLAGGRIRHKSQENFAAALRQAEEMGVRTAVFANPWTIYGTLKYIEALLEAEIADGTKAPGDHYVDLAPGSVLITGGGNKSGLEVPEEEVLDLFHRLVGGCDKTSDAWSQAECFGVALRCAEGNYHLDPHVEYFLIDSYLAYYDPRQTWRVPATISGDVVDGIHEEPCPCGQPTRFFKSVQRDDKKRGSRGCAAALAEYG